MTELEWLRSEDPAAIIESIRLSVGAALFDRHIQNKFRLFVEAETGITSWLYIPLHVSWSDFASEVIDDTPTKTKKEQACILRDIFLYRAITPSTHNIYKTKDKDVPESIKDSNSEVVLSLCRTCNREEAELKQPCSWLIRNSNVLEIAKYIQEKNDFEPMPILADALEEAGCTNQDILNHCRGLSKQITKHYECPICGYECRPVTNWLQGTLTNSYICENPNWRHFPPHSWVTPEEGKIIWRKCNNTHVRGCWVLDLLLGES